MAVNDYCPINIEVSSSPGLETANVAGIGSASSPIALTINQRIDTTQPNALTENANGLFVDICDTGTCVEGLLNTNSGLNHPVDANKDILIGMGYTDGSSVSFNSGTGMYTLARAVPFHESTWPYSPCTVASGAHVYANTATGLLYTDPAPYKLTKFDAAVGTQATTTMSVGQIYNQVLTGVNHTQLCGRTLTGSATYQWDGYQVKLDNGDSITVAHEIFDGSVWSAPTQSYFNNTSGGTIRTTLGAGYSHTRPLSIGSGLAKLIGTRLRVTATTGTPTLINTNSVFSNSYYVDLDTN